MLNKANLNLLVFLRKSCSSHTRAVFLPLCFCPSWKQHHLILAPCETNMHRGFIFNSTRGKLCDCVFSWLHGAMISQLKGLSKVNIDCFPSERKFIEIRPVSSEWGGTIRLFLSWLLVECLDPCKCSHRLVHEFFHLFLMWVFLNPHDYI